MDSSDNDRCITWARDSYAAMQPFAASGRYVNYLDPAAVRTNARPTPVRRAVLSSRGPPPACSAAGVLTTVHLALDLTTTTWLPSRSSTPGKGDRVW